MVYLAGNGAWLGFSHVMIGLIALGLSIAFANLVPKDIYGTYRFLLSIFWILTAFSLTGTSLALLRAVARGEDGAYLPALRQSIIWSTPMMCIGLGVAGYYFVNENIVLALGALVIAFIGPFMQSAYLYGSFLEGKRAFKENALAGVVLNTIPAIALLITMFFIHNPVVFLLVFLSGSILTGYAISYFVYKRYKPDTNNTSPTLSNLSFHFSAMNLLSTLAQQIDRLLVFHYLGAAQLAAYTLATALPDQVKTLFNNVSTLALPKFVQRPFDEIRANLPRRLILMTIAAAGITVVYIFIAPLVFQFLFPAYTESIFFSQLYALALIPVANIIPLTVLEAQAAKRRLYAYNIISPVVQIALLLGLIPVFGIIGAVIARIAGRVFTLLLGIILLYVNPKASSQP